MNNFKVAKRFVIPPVFLALHLCGPALCGILPAATAAYCAESTGEVRTVTVKGGESFDFAYIPAGSFLMGADPSDPDAETSEWPRHTVVISHGLWMLRNEVTQSQWESVMGSNPSYFKNDPGAGREDSPLDDPSGDTQKYHSGRAGCPVERVSWNDCEKFITALNSKEVGVFRLPSEAEWEYACRAGSEKAYYWGDAPAGRCLWHMGNAYNKPQMARQKEPNAWGLFDMSGNIAEWCSDWNGPVGERTGAAAVDPKGPPSGDYKVVRGGSWAVRASHSRSASRSAMKPSESDMYTGLRLVWEPPAQKR